jgi:hypothetical protein
VCSISGCSQKAAKFSAMCRTHITATRRWGHALQRPIAKGELKRLNQLTTSILAARSNHAEIQKALQDRYESLSMQVRADAGRTGASTKTFLQSTKVLRIICNEVEPTQVIQLGVSIGYLAAEDKNRFRSDNAFFASCGRRAWLLSNSAFRCHRNFQTGTNRRTAMDLRPRTQVEVGRRLVEAFAITGMKLHEIERRSALKAREVAQAPIQLLEASVGDERGD